MTLLASEFFEYAEGPAFGLNGGFGWQESWQVQDDYPTIQITTGSLEYSDLQNTSLGNKISGGAGYRGCGRRFFANPEQLSVIYASITVNRNQTWGNFFSLHGGAFSAFPPGDGIFFGSDGGANFLLWTDGDTQNTGISYPSDGTIQLLVCKIEYVGSNFTANLFVNPIPGESEPVTSNATITGTNSGVRAIHLYIGDSNDVYFNSDNIRIADTWADVLPGSALITNNAAIFASLF